jgi:hypothetical protein
MKVLYNAGFIDKIGLDNVCANIDMALERSRQLPDRAATAGHTARNDGV